MGTYKYSTTFSKVTALLCALMMLLGIFFFLSTSTSGKIDYLNDQIKYHQEQIDQKETYIDQCQKDIAASQEELRTWEAALPAAEEAVENDTQTLKQKQSALVVAENNLDKVCSRSSYNSRYCTGRCFSLHGTVSNQQKAVTKAETTLKTSQKQLANIESRILQHAKAITQEENNIQNAQRLIEELQDEINACNKELTGAWFVVIFQALAMLLALIGLGILVKNFYTLQQDTEVFYAVICLAISSVLFLITGMIRSGSFVYLLLSPHAWNLVAMWLLATVLRGTAKNPVLLRNLTIVLLVIVGVLLIATGAPLAGVLYVAAMICAAFLIVPLVFTGYVDIAKHIFLSIITCGIWLLVWTYCVTKHLNNTKTAEKRRPARELLLCMFLAFYYPYWLYKTAEGVENYGKEKNKEFKIDTLCIVFAFVCPLFATVLIQNKLNVVVSAAACAEPDAQEICQ